jgi:hypothetical protein
MARFQREAQVLASLNHPNIASIYGLEDSGKTRALVMELVEGPTLADRIKFGAIPLEETLPIAKQITEALEAAHDKGIIHRDLKPANVKVTPEGTVKVLDFGLAKALETQHPAADISNSPTLALAATQAGVILGTAAYMSPEQAKGKVTDRRGDIWAFGCVLYEMLTAKQAFGGETASETLAAIIKDEAYLNGLPAGTPAAIRTLLRRCLHKDPRRRLQAIGDARNTIEEAISGSPETEAVRERPMQQSAGRRAASWAAGAILVCLAALGGWWFGTRSVIPAPRWSGDLLGGSSVAFGPRVSPDGHTVAFQAMVDNLTQVAVMNPDSGNWTVLTHDRSRGIVQEIAWSRDGSKLYFDRVVPQPAGIYTVPSLGGDERLVLEDAATPGILPDSSLLVTRIDPDRKQRIYHYWPDSGRLQPLGGWLATNDAVAPLRVFPDGKEAVFWGMADGMNSGSIPHLYALDIATGRTRQLAPQLAISQTGSAFALAVTPDNRSVLIDLPSGNLRQIVAIPRFGSGPGQPLITLTAKPWLMDAGSDGTLYLDQVERPLQILRFPVSGGTPEVITASEDYPAEWMQPVEFPDGRFLLPALLSGRPRLLIGKPGGNFFPLVDTADETGPPAALLSDNQVAFIAGTGSDQTIAIASARDGRIIRHLQGVKGQYATSLAASPDGKTLFYTTAGNLWAVPAADGTPRKICTGDSVAVDPDGKELTVTLVENGGTRLVRISVSGGPARDVRVQSGLPINPTPLGGNSVRKDGKLLVGVVPKDSWFFSVAMLDPGSGAFTRIPLNYIGDIFVSNWTNDGRILAFGEPMRAHVWRFRPVH